MEMATMKTIDDEEYDNNNSNIGRIANNDSSAELETTTLRITQSIKNDVTKTDTDILATNTDNSNTRPKRTRQPQHRPDFVQFDSDFIVATDTKNSEKPKKNAKEVIEEEFATTWICVECKEAECNMMIDDTSNNAGEVAGADGEEQQQPTDCLLICDGVCRRVFHYPCAGLQELPKEDESFYCSDCTEQKHLCTLCNHYGYDNDDVFKCYKQNCGLFYHESCLMMQNIDITRIAVPTKSRHGDNVADTSSIRVTSGSINIVEGDNFINDDDDDDFVENNSSEIISNTDNNNKDIGGSRIMNGITTAIKIERRFVCPAHSCWTCTQIDLKEEEQQQEDDEGINKTSSHQKKKGNNNNKKKKKRSGTFESKRDSFLTRCLECPISYHISCIPPSAKFHELATLCHIHSQRCKLPYLDPKDSLQQKIEDNIDQKFLEYSNKSNNSKRKTMVRLGQNPFLPFVSGTALTSSESDVLTALQNDTTNDEDNDIQLWFCLPCDIKDEVHSQPPSYRHVQSLQYAPSHKPTRIPPPDDVCSCLVVCDENCINRILYSECYGNINDSTTKNGTTTKSTNCAVGGNCGNRQLGQRITAKCKPLREKGKGWGLVLLKNALQGDLIQEYVGEVVDEDTKEKRLIEWYSEHPNDPNFYLMALQPGWFIDARNVANLSRFINHSCDPNCVLQQINVNGKMRCGIFALRDIPAGDYLSYDYHFDTKHGDRFICTCGAKNCRGTMKGGKDANLLSDGGDKFSKKSKAVTWDDAKASYERDKKFLSEYEDDCKTRCTQVGTIVPDGDKDEYVMNGPQKKYCSYGQQQRLFLWRNAVLTGTNFQQRFARMNASTAIPDCDAK